MMHFGYMVHFHLRSTYWIHFNFSQIFVSPPQKKKYLPAPPLFPMVSSFPEIFLSSPFLNFSADVSSYKTQILFCLSKYQYLLFKHRGFFLNGFSSTFSRGGVKHISFGNSPEFRWTHPPKKNRQSTMLHVHHQQRPTLPSSIPWTCLHLHNDRKSHTYWRMFLSTVLDQSSPP